MASPLPEYRSAMRPFGQRKDLLPLHSYSTQIVAAWITGRRVIQA